MKFELAFSEKVSGQYILDLTKDYQDRTKWPLIVCLHGYGESGDDLEFVKTNGPPKLVASGKQFPFILISPQCPSGFYWRPIVLMALIDHIVETFLFLWYNFVNVPNRALKFYAIYNMIKPWACQ